MVVAGLDFGSATCRVAVAGRNSVEIVTDAIGDRQTISMVAYHAQERRIGLSAAAQYPMFPAESFTGMKQFMGLLYEDVTALLETVSFTLRDLANDGIGFNLTGAIVYPEQVVATLLHKLHEMVERHHPVSDFVIGIPCYWSDAQRQALLDAAVIAGLRVPRLLTETTAVALQYGILKPVQTPTRVLFVDIGVTATCASVIVFTPEGLEVLCTAYNPTLGGRDVDQLLFQYVATQIQTKYGLDVRDHVRRRIVTYRECERVKRMLSSNRVVLFTLELTDLDVHIEVTRVWLDAAMAHVFLPRLTHVLDQLTHRDMSLMEVVGGTTRIPCVQAHLAHIVALPVGRTCDASDSVARGCAIQCAMLCPSVQVRPFVIQERLARTIGLAFYGSFVNTHDLASFMPLFQPPVLFPTTRLISIPNHSGPLWLFTQSGLTAARYLATIQVPPAITDVTIHLEFTLNDCGMCAVTRAFYQHQDIDQAQLEIMRVPCFSPERLAQLIEVEHELTARDLLALDVSRVRNDLEQISLHARSVLASLSADDASIVQNTCALIDAWLYELPYREPDEHWFRTLQQIMQAPTENK